MTETVETIDNTPLTAEQVRATLDLQPNGVHLSCLGEDGEGGYLAYGQVSDEDFRRAIRTFGGIGCDDEYDTDDIDRGWAVFTPHEDACTGRVEYDPGDFDPCRCDEFGWFLSGGVLSDVAEANAKRPGAVAVTLWTF